MNTYLLLFGIICSLSAFSFPRDWEHGVFAQITRCFEIKSIQASCEGYEPNDTKHSAELNIEALGNDGHKYSYGYYKMIEGSLCRVHLAKIKALSKGISEACITGEAQTELKNHETIFKFRAFETKNGYVKW